MHVHGSAAIKTSIINLRPTPCTSLGSTQTPGASRAGSQAWGASGGPLPCNLRPIGRLSPAPICFPQPQKCWRGSLQFVGNCARREGAVRTSTQSPARGRGFEMCAMDMAAALEKTVSCFCPPKEGTAEVLAAQDEARISLPWPGDEGGVPWGGVFRASMVPCCSPRQHQLRVPGQRSPCPEHPPGLAEPLAGTVPAQQSGEWWHPKQEGQASCLSPCKASADAMGGTGTGATLACP